MMESVLHSLTHQQLEVGLVLLNVNLTSDKKKFRSEDDTIKQMYISALNDVQNYITFKFTNKLMS